MRYLTTRASSILQGNKITRRVANDNHFQKISASTVRFRFDGAAINDNDTPQALEMEDGDAIEVFQPQTGGWT